MDANTQPAVPAEPRPFIGWSLTVTCGTKGTILSHEIIWPDQVQAKMDEVLDRAAEDPTWDAAIVVAIPVDITKD